MLEPTASPNLVTSEAGHGETTATAVERTLETRDGTKRGFALTMITTATCPCLPAAQVASAVGIPYVWVLLSFTVVYSVCTALYMLAANADHTFVEGTSVLSAYGAQTTAYIGGPFVALLVAFYKYSNTRWSSGLGTLITSVGETDEQLNAGMTVSAESVAFVAADLVLNLLLALVILHLYKRLDRRMRFSSGKGSFTCGSTMGVVCCASCSLFEMVWVARDAASKPQYYLGAINVLPAFESHGIKEKSGQTLNASVAACPA